MRAKAAVIRTLVAFAALTLLAISAVHAAPAQRIVSLAPNITELLYTAGAGDRLIAAVEFSNFPAAAKSLPRVGDAFRVDYERVVELKPDLVIAWTDGTPSTIVDELHRLKQPVRELRIAGLADVATALRQLGTWAGTSREADRAADEYLAKLAALRAAHTSQTPLTVFFEISQTPLYTVNDQHPISEVIRLCGGRNVFSDLGELAPAVGVESVLARDPQVILAADDEPGALAYWQRWPQLTAVRDGNLYPVSSDRISRATVRILEGAEQVCRALSDVRQRRAAQSQ
jgi:iron complex transport system substrate-binding protein